MSKLYSQVTDFSFQLLLPDISRQQTIFLSDLRFLVQWFDVQSVCDCSALQWAVCLSKCVAAAPVFLFGVTRHFVLFPVFKEDQCARNRSPSDVCCLFNGPNGKNSSRSIVLNIFFLGLYFSRLVIASTLFFCHTDCYLGNQDCKLNR